MRMKRVTVWKNINYMLSRDELIIKKRKRWEKFVAFIIYIDKR